jgi:outer membrane lipoprotein-sorting protein
VPVLAAVLLLGGASVATRIAASAQDGLPPRSAAQLLVDLHRAHLDGFSGTVVQRADLGLPDLPGGSSSSDLSSLVSGTHTLKVWAAEPHRARLALLGDLGESDVVVDGKDMWTWSSKERTATHRVLDLPKGHDDARPQHDQLPGTPLQAAQRLVKAVEPSTEVTTSGTAVVAGRRAYELVLEPRDAASLVGQVRIAVDGRTHVPLRVQVFPRSGDTPAFETAFTRFEPTPPDPSVFAFEPPPGTKVTEKHSPAPGSRPMLPGTPGLLPGPTVVGDGWTTVLVSDLPAGTSAGVGLPDQLAGVVRGLPEVSGPWGSGRLLRGTLFTVLLTDDGQMAFGAVEPQRLYDAVAHR